MTSKEINKIIDYLKEDEGTYNEEVMDLICPEYGTLEFSSTAETLLYLLGKGMDAVRHHQLSIDELLGRCPLKAS